MRGTTRFLRFSMLAVKAASSSLPRLICVGYVIKVCFIIAIPLRNLALHFQAQL